MSNEEKIDEAAIEKALKNNDYLQRVVDDTPSLLKDSKFMNFLVNQEQQRKEILQATAQLSTAQKEATEQSGWSVNDRGELVDEAGKPVEAGPPTPSRAR